MADRVESINIRRLSNFVKIGQTVAEISLFNGFQNGGSSPIWIFLKFKISSVS